ncbi:MAG: TetR/AcrR family transcriptional regulator [Gammaproteobacteria bacterium]
MSKRAYDNSVREQQRQQKRDEVVKAMAQAMSAGGEDIPLAEVARQAGVSKRTIYHYFPDRAARIEAIDQWLDAQVDVDEILPRDFGDIGDYIERLVHYALANEVWVKAQMAPGLPREVRTMRKRRHRKALVAALAEKIDDDAVVDELSALILSAVRAEAVFDMAEIYRLSERRIKLSFRTMVEALIDEHM